MRVVAFAIGFLLLVAYWPGISGLATTPRWDVGAAFALMFFFAPPVRITPSHVLLVALIAWLGVTLAWSPERLNGADQVLKFAVVAIAFAWGSSRVDIGAFIAGAATGMALSSIVAIAQWCGWRPVESYGLVGGLFYNGDRLGEAAALVFAAALARRMWWAMPAVLPALVFAESRIAFLAAIAALAAWIWTEGRTFERFVLTMIAGYVLLGASMLSPFWLGGGLAERVALYGFTATHLNWLGHGLASFSGSGMRLGAGASLSYPSHPHSEWLWLAYEGGVIAVALCGALAALLWRGSAGPLRVVLVAALVQSLFFMPWHDPASVFFTAVVAGHLVGAGARIRDAAEHGRAGIRQGLPAVSAG